MTPQETATPTLRPLKIDLVSDVVCPWCAIGLNGLEIALERLKGVVQAEIHLQPFQLNPSMPPEGEDIVDHLSRKYGMSAEQVAANQEAIRQRGQSVGFEFRMDRRGRTWNTFDAHRLLHWAGLQGRGLALKHALLSAYFTDGENPGDPAVLVRCATAAGLDPVQAQEVLSSGAHAADVRAQLARYAGLGIRSVPSFIIDDQHLIEGGQPPELFEQALRELASR